MAIRGIHHVAVSTHDLDRLVRFYEEALGFTPVSEQFAWSDSPEIDSIIGVEGSAARTVMLKAGNAYLEIFEFSSPASASTTPKAPNDRGYTHFAVDSDDIAADFARLQAAGMRFVRSEYGDMGEIKAIYGSDPDGNVIELQQVAPAHPTSLARRRLPVND
ncbi:VOC family protein [Erythrobacter sp.]|uniref:VOC family protein n=1 Tax=Erythrobacter sp. TaxID=1042 RepID=UPI001425CF34|nr:VOC family protein [Erythrobacter sp.]QIQ86108.1 MAG: lactoylglutathione lyase [Erythrobacter sp.]